MANSGACVGIQVVELGSGSVAGSIAGMLLADNGARVLRVEAPEGDRLRSSYESGFLVWNRGKESVVADLRTPEGVVAVRELLANADAVIEPFGVGVADDWEIGYEAARALNPSLVYCSIKGFGSKGGYAHLKAYEGVVAAKAGFFTRGEFGIRPGPTFNGGLFGNLGAAHMAAAGILGALMVRDKTGKGQHVEATLVQGLSPYDYFGTMTWQARQRAGGGSAPGGSAASGASRLSFLVPTKDGRWMHFTHMMPHQATALSRALGLGHLLDDPRHARQPFFDTAEDAQAWEDMVWDVLATRTYAEWESILLEDPDIAFEVARRADEGLDHPQIRHNGNAIVVHDPLKGPIEQIGPVAAFSATPAQIDRSAPALGDHGAPPALRAPVPSSDAMPVHPLSGITIVELGYFYAMPFGVTLAASMGARVIKLEGISGDPMRTSFGPGGVGGSKTMEGKESLAVDLSTEEGREVAYRVIAQADVFINGFRPGVAERLHLDRETLTGVNPDLLYVHATGWGSSGPYSHRPIYAGVAAALAGNLHRHAGYWLDPDITTPLSRDEAQAIVLPRLRGPSDGDASAALAVFTTIMLGLLDRSRTGRSQLAETTMIGANGLAYSDDFVRFSGKKPVPVPDPDNFGLHALYRLYPARTGWIFLAAPLHKEWEALAVAIGRPDLLTDDRFGSPAARQANDDALADVLTEAFASKDALDWELGLSAKGVGCAAAFEGSHSEFTCTDPVMRETGLVVEIDDPRFGRVLRHGLPVRLSETPGVVTPGSTVGQHTETIMLEHGYSAADVADLVGRGIVGGRDQGA